MARYALSQLIVRRIPRHRFVYERTNGSERICQVRLGGPIMPRLPVACIESLLFARR